MNSKRLLEIANYVSLNDSVLDVGCDHAYLSIYLKKNNLCKNVIASDISENAIEYAKNNIFNSKVNINTYVSDGLNNINEYYDTLVIAGMGTSTILNILDNKNVPNKLILCSNNEHYKLRKELNKLGYKLLNESIVLENNHYYVIMNYIKGKQRLNKSQLKYGINNDKDYYNYLYNRNKEIIPKANFKKKLELLNEQRLLKKLLKKSRII